MTDEHLVALDGMMPALLQARRFDDAGQIVRRVTAAAIAARPPVQGLPGNLVVTGPPRVGKSLLTQAIVARTGALVVNADRLRLWFLGDPDADRREASRLAVYGGVLSAAPRGIILDGDDCMTGNRSAHGGFLPVGLDRLVRWQAAGLARAVVVGCPDLTPQQKHGTLLLWRATGRCWTSTHPVYADDATLPDLARVLVEASRTLRDVCAAERLHFVSLGDAGFAAGIAAAATALTDPVVMRTQAQGAVAER